MLISRFKCIAFSSINKLIVSIYYGSDKVFSIV